MENIIFYSDRYQAVNLIDKAVAKFVNVIPPATAELDLYIFDQILNKELNEKKYKNIYIPLSPFSAYANYLGLRIGLYVKLSDSINKLSNIIIYGCDDTRDLTKNECSQILNFQEVSLIDFSKEAIIDALTTDIRITEENWLEQINKIQLTIPEDYFDSHSIANEWGIYQMARNSGIDIEEIIGVDLNKFKRLYFRWLIFKNQLNESIPIEQKEEQKRYAERLKGPTITGNIDLSKFNKR